MKRFIAFLLLLNAVFLGVIAWQLVNNSKVGGKSGLGEGLRERILAIKSRVDRQETLTGQLHPVAISGKYTDLTNRPPAAQALSEEQVEIFGHLSIERLPINDDGKTAKTIRFSGVNVQVVNGMHGTSSANGLGNLIVGYQRFRTDDNKSVTDDTNDRSGSHNLVVGEANNYNGFACQVVGYRNTVSGHLSSVTGGSNNTASGKWSTIGGGDNNTASEIFCTVGGGGSNTASGYYSTIGGGGSNKALSGGERNGMSTVSGGFSNTASGTSSTVSGGAMNIASTTDSTVSGGRVNKAIGTAGTVSGGFSCIASGSHATVSGGREVNATSYGSHFP